MSTSSPKGRAAALTIVLALALSILKLSLGLLANSISLISSAVDSLLDLLMAALNYLSIRSADKPADREHSYGHGKIENLSGFIQAGVIAVFSFLIIWAALRRLIREEMPTSPGLGIVVMLIACTTSFFLARYLQRVAEREESVALEANALNLRVDVYTGAGIIAALALVRQWTEAAKLTLHPTKTKIVDAVQEGFDFLGYHFKRGERFPRA
ncbi:MAG: cation diffusion facilitator family transporter, partial [Nitrospinota bacterium]